MKIIFFALLLSTVCLSCDVFDKTDFLTIKNYQANPITVTQISGKFTYSPNIILQSGESIMYEENFHAEGADLTLVIAETSFLADIGYIIDYGSLTVTLLENNKYVVSTTNKTVFSSDLQLIE